MVKGETAGWKAMNHLVVLLLSGKLERQDSRKRLSLHIYPLIRPAGRPTPSCWRSGKHPSLDRRPHRTPARNLHFNFPAERLSAGDKQALFTPFCSCEVLMRFCWRKWFTCFWVGVWKRASLDVITLNQRRLCQNVQLKARECCDQSKTSRSVSLNSGVSKRFDCRSWISILTQGLKQQQQINGVFWWFTS